MIVLSERLQAIADRVPTDARLADIGSDHGLLPAYLLLKDQISHAIAGEVRQGPLEATRQQMESLGLGDRVNVRLGDGLQVLHPEEVDTIVIAGMGGSLITNILTAGKDRLHGVKRLILQPNVAAKEVREWLRWHDWYLEEETILEEDGYIYEILVAVPKQNQPELYKPLQLPCGFVVEPTGLLMMGPHLLRNPKDPLITKWNRELQKRQRIMDQLAFSQAESSQRKAEALRQEIKLISEVLACLQRDKQSSN